MTAPGVPLRVWLVRDLSLGGAALVIDTTIVPGERIPLALHIAGQKPLAVTARLLRRQVAAPRGQCAVEFDPLTPEQSAVIAQAIDAAASTPRAPATPTVVVVGRSSPTRAALARELGALGLNVRALGSPLEAAAWLPWGAAAAVLVEDKCMELEGWNFVEFVRNTVPHARRIVIASDVHSFRLNLALRSGLADAVIERPFQATMLARKLGVETATPETRRRARRSG